MVVAQLRGIKFDRDEENFWRPEFVGTKAMVKVRLDVFEAFGFKGLKRGDNYFDALDQEDKGILKRLRKGSLKQGGINT